MATSPAPASIREPAAARRIENPLIGDVATILVTSEESGGERTLLQIELAPGGGNPIHFHKTYTERFTVLEGQLTVHASGRDHELGVGDELLAAIGERHHFANRSGEPVVFLVELRPGHRGFEKALQAGYGLATDGKTNDKSVPKSPLQAAVLLLWSDMGMPGIWTVLERPLRLLARLARRRGIDRELEQRYVRY
jgi:quercetin dioxygenase-like cupin family protein